MASEVYIARQDTLESVQNTVEESNSTLGNFSGGGTDSVVTELNALKQAVAALTTKTDGLQTDVTNIKTDVGTIETTIAGLGGGSTTGFGNIAYQDSTERYSNDDDVVIVAAKFVAPVSGVYNLQCEMKLETNFLQQNLYLLTNFQDLDGGTSRQIITPSFDVMRYYQMTVGTELRSDDKFFEINSYLYALISHTGSTQYEEKNAMFYCKAGDVVVLILSFGRDRYCYIRNIKITYGND